MENPNQRIPLLVNLPVRHLYFGRLNYAFKDRYMFTFTARADGTNVFAPENRWGFFPGMALAWRISQGKIYEADGRLAG